MLLNFKTISWEKGKIKILDQTALPTQVIYQTISTVEDIAQAIKNLKVRGAPLIGVAAAYGVALSATLQKDVSYDEFKKSIEKDIAIIANTRPTAYNLFAALDRMKNILENENDTNFAKSKLIEEAEQIRREDEEICQKIGEYGEPLIPDNSKVLTHCNAGALATAGIGTALAPIYLAKERGKHIEVFASETRPLLQGARLTVWELAANKIAVTLICDSAAGVVLTKKNVDLCIVGADRIASNGDTANKIGTYSMAVLAKENGIPLYVAAPNTTFDKNIESGADIPIEERSDYEIIKLSYVSTAPQWIRCFNPAFDVTPAKYIDAFITDRGILKPPFKQSMNRLLP
jgi:methylthioribose-1-phosphate isomerase